MSETEQVAVARQVAVRDSATTQTSQSLIRVIEVAASNPNVDIDKMERLLAMHERILTRGAEEQYNIAFAAMQGALPTITKDGAIRNRQGEVQSRYARFEDIHAAIQPILVEHGFAVSFRIESSPLGPRVSLKMMHRGGHHEVTPFLDVPRDKTGSKNDAQSVGSSIQYGKRYVECAFLNINTEGEDVDAQSDDAAVQDVRRPSGKPATREPQAIIEPGTPISAPQITMLRSKMKSAGVAESLVLAQFEIGAIEQLTFDKINAALSWIDKNGHE